MVVAKLPGEDGEPSNRCAEETARDHIAEEMKIGADEADRDGDNKDGIERATPRTENPQDTPHHTDGLGRPERKRDKPRPAMKWIEAIDTVMNEGRVVPDPGFRPGATEDEFEVVLD